MPNVNGDSHATKIVSLLGALQKRLRIIKTNHTVAIEAELIDRLHSIPLPVLPVVRITAAGNASAPILQHK